MEDDNRCFFKTPSTSFSIFWVLREEKSINHVLPKRGRVGPFSTVIISISSVGVALVEVVRHVFVAYGEAVLMICFDSRLHARWIWEGSCLLVVSLRCFRVFCGVEDPGCADPSPSWHSHLLLHQVLVWWGWAHYHHIYLLQKYSCSCVSQHRVLLALSAPFPSGRRSILSLNNTYPTRMRHSITNKSLVLRSSFDIKLPFWGWMAVLSLLYRDRQAWRWSYLSGYCWPELLWRPKCGSAIDIREVR